MTTNVFSRIAELDPAREPEATPDWDTLAPVLLSFLDERTMPMNTQTPQKVQQDQPTRRQGRLVAVATFAVVILFVGAVMFFTNTAEDLPPSSPPLTEEVPPEVETIAESAVAAPIDVAEAWFALYDAGDVAGYQALMSADATWSWHSAIPYFDNPPYYAVADSDATDSRTLYAGHGSLNATCAADGNVVTCDTERASLFGWFDEDGEPQAYQRGTRVFTVEDGVVTDYTIVTLQGLQGEWFNRAEIAAYGRWLSQNHPKDHAELFWGPTILVSDSEQAERHHAFVADWAAG